MKNLRMTKGITVNSSYRIGALTRTNTFYNNISKIHVNIGLLQSDDVAKYDFGNELIYNTSNGSLLEQEALRNITDLLLQLRAAQSDQNVFVQNNTVVRQQILDQLKREIFNVQNNLTQKEVKQLEVVSNNLFDEDTLNDLIKSLLSDTKKKLDYSWDPKSNNIALREPETSLTNTKAITSFKPIDVIKKYQNILYNTINNFSTDRVLRKNNIINKTRYYDAEQTRNELVIREVKQPVEVTTEEFIRKENLIENLEKVYNEKLLKRVDFTPLVTKTFLKTLESGGIKNYKEIVSKVWDKVYLKSEVPETTLLTHHKITDKINSVELKQDFIDTYFNKILTQDITGLTLYKDITRAYRSKKLNLKNVLINNSNKDFIETDILKRYNYITRSANEKVYKNKLLTEANLINKTVDYEIEQNRNVAKTRNTFLYETEVEKVYKKSVFNKDVRNENRLTTVKFENEFTNVIETVAKKTAETVTQNKLLNRYENMIETTVERVFKDTVENRRSRTNSKVINKKNVKSFKDITDVTSKLSVINEFEKQYEKSAFNVENLKERVLNRKAYHTLKNTLNALEITNEKHLDIVKHENEIINRHNKLVSNIIENVGINRNIDRTNLVNKYVKNDKDIEQLVNKIIENQPDENLIKSLISKSKNVTTSEINRLINVNNYRDVINQIDTNLINNYNENEIKRIIETENLINRNVSNKVDILEYLPQIQKIQENILNTKEIKRVKDRTYSSTLDYVDKILSKNLIEINEEKINEHIKNYRDKIQSNLTILNLVESNAKGREVFNDVVEKRYRENLFVEQPNKILEKIEKLYNVNKVVNQKKVNVLPPTILQHRRTRVNENTIYREVEENQLSYHTQEVEDIAKATLINDNESLNLSNITEMVYKKDPVYNEIKKVEQKQQEAKKEDEERIVKRIESKIAPILRKAQKAEPQVSNVKQEKGLTTKEVENLIQSYISDINVSTISKIVINEVQQKMSLDRRRRGIM